jgi:23S rRNA (cytosine1962-C5)-methyltransferase
MRYPKLTVKRGRERSVRQRHPWLFSGSIARIDSDAEDGGIVDVLSADGEWLACGFLNRRSQITARLLSWDKESEIIDRSFWRARLARAKAARSGLMADQRTTAYRLVNAESDGFPGLVVDRYDDWLVLQVSALAMEQRKQELVELLVAEINGVRGIYERSDVDVRDKEGLSPVVGRLWGDEPEELVEVQEIGHAFLVDLRKGQKTGFYLDQRQNRVQLPTYCAGVEALNAFSYTGAFAVYALAGGASSVVNVDASDDALVLARRNVALNGFAEASATYEAADVFAQLRAYRAAGRGFDLVILDPPRFALSRSQIARASRGYKDINWVALQLIRQGGVLFTFSCSGLVSRELFQKIVFSAAIDAGRDVQIVGQLSQADDHPIAVTFPEAAYLKGLICRVW